MGTRIKIVLLACLLLPVVLMEEVNPVMSKQTERRKERIKVLEGSMKEVKEEMKIREEKIKEQGETIKELQEKMKELEKCKGK